MVFLVTKIVKKLEKRIWCALFFQKVVSLQRRFGSSLPPQGGGGKSEQHRAPCKLTA